MLPTPFSIRPHSLALSSWLLFLSSLGLVGCLAEGTLDGDASRTEVGTAIDMPRDTAPTSPSSSLDTSPPSDVSSMSSAETSSGCTDGKTRTCGTSEGTCQKGTQTCNDGTWGPCRDATSPSEETCNGEDDDCDGEVDEGLEKTCGQNEGQCQTGTKTCQDGQWGECSGTMPSEETCNRKDDDCDGEVDEGNVCGPCDNGETRECGNRTGTCKAGTQTCENNQWGPCKGGTDASQEVCDGKDNDCDGTPDENLRKTCGKSKGACETGTRSCSGGEWQSCTGGRRASKERCNGRDDDCDGEVDEGLAWIGGDCDTGQSGVCSKGKLVCNSGRRECRQTKSSSSEVCDGKDNDCDGAIDNLTRPCGTSKGLCREGTQRCSGGQWQPCSGGRQPSSETCDGLDNDCDGVKDNGLSKPCDEQKGVCQGATRPCKNGSYIPSCDAQQYGSNYESDESSCGDGLDNNCDGEVDCADFDCNDKTCNGPGTACDHYDFGGKDEVCDETACRDGKDNDGDGDVDCQDSDCDFCDDSGAKCMPDGTCKETECDDYSDNDDDGKENCADPDCDGRVCGSCTCQSFSAPKVCRNQQCQCTC
jgi:hypothetical protein